MKILFLVNHEVTLYYFRMELLKALVDAGNEVYLSMPRQEHAEAFEKMGCKIIETPITQYGMNPIKEYKLIKIYKSILNRLSPDVVVTFTIKPALYGGIACAAKKVPYISAITGLGGAFEKGALFKAIITLMYKYATRSIGCMIFENSANSEIFEQMGIAKGKHLVVSGAGVNLEKHKFEEYPEEKGTKLLFVGRMMRDKGIFELVEAVKKARETYADLTLDIIGWCEKECEELKNSFTEDGGIHYLGWQEDVHGFVNACHAVVLPSYHEGMANALLESSSSGRPILASNIPGCREAFDDKVTGVGFEARSTDSLYEAIMYFAGLTNEQRAEMGRLARQKMEKEFDRKKVVEEYIKEIKKIAKI
ncbi:MAG: glycosyltransferase family 4 protein [Acutalibacteraceae bacterium]